MPQALLPDLGQIGANVFFEAGANRNPFQLGTGSYVGGGLDLPLAKVPGGRLNYEISIGLAQNSQHEPITSNVAQVTNLALLTAISPSGGTQNVLDAFSGTGAAPFAVTTNAKWNAQILQVVPIALRYDITRFDRKRILPYAVAGLGTFVTLSNQTTTGGLRTDSTLSASQIALLKEILLAFAIQTPPVNTTFAFSP